MKCNRNGIGSRDERDLSAPQSGRLLQVVTEGKCIHYVIFYGKFKFEVKQCIYCIPLRCRGDEEKTSYESGKRRSTTPLGNGRTTLIEVIPRKPLRSTSTPVIERNAASLSKKTNEENKTTETLYRPIFIHMTWGH